MRTLKVTGLLLATLLIVTLPTSARGRLGGRIMVGPSFGAWDWYSPYYGPYGLYGPYYPIYQGAYSGAGEIKLKTNIKDAEVFINGAYAGKAAKLKTMWMRPNTYILEIRAAGYAPFSEKVYLLPGKTMHIDVTLIPSPQPSKPQG
jgi:hypothetical protein